MEKGYRQPKGMRLSPCVKMQGLQPVENPKLAAIARKQRYAGLREKCCGTRVRGAAPITPAGTAGKRVSSGHNRRRRLATRRCDTKRVGTTVVVPATIEWQHCLLHLHFFDTLSGQTPLQPQNHLNFIPIGAVVIAEGSGRAAGLYEA